MKIGIFCSANKNIDAEYFRLTEEVGAWIASEGHALVFGGCNMGLMECVGRAAHAGDATTIGVVPRVVERGGGLSDSVTVHISCETLSDRKELLLAHSDVLVALPGGLGTLDEIFTVAAAHTIGYHSKMVILYNAKDFYRPLIALLDDLQAQGMVRGHWTDYIRVADTFDELKAMIAQTGSSLTV